MKNAPIAGYENRQLYPSWGTTESLDEPGLFFTPHEGGWYYTTAFDFQDVFMVGKTADTLDAAVCIAHDPAESICTCSIFGEHRACTHLAVMQQALSQFACCGEEIQEKLHE